MIDFVMLWAPEPGSPYALRDRGTGLPAYVVHMVRQLVRGCAMDRRFTVLAPADHAADGAFVIDGVRVRLVPLARAWGGRTGWCFAKLEAFRPEVGLGERAVLTDLDNLVVGPIEGMLSHWFATSTADFGARAQFAADRTGSHWQSSWVHFRPERAAGIWQAAADIGPKGLANAFPPRTGGGDQAYLSAVRPHPTRSHGLAAETRFGDDLAERYPGAFASCRWGWADGRAPNAAVVYCHGRPKPHAWGDPCDVRTWTHPSPGGAP